VEIEVRAQVEPSLGARWWRRSHLHSAPGVVLKENGIFFVDVAPRYEACEGDGGAPLVVGHDEQLERCARNAQELFHEVRAAWRPHDWTGTGL